MAHKTPPKITHMGRGEKKARTMQSNSAAAESAIILQYQQLKLWELSISQSCSGLKTLYSFARTTRGIFTSLNSTCTQNNPQPGVGYHERRN